MNKLIRQNDNKYNTCFTANCLRACKNTAKITMRIKVMEKEAKPDININKTMLLFKLVEISYLTTNNDIPNAIIIPNEFG